jgi:hypothetical protein
MLKNIKTTFSISLIKINVYVYYFFNIFKMYLISISYIYSFLAMITDDRE